MQVKFRRQTKSAVKFRRRKKVPLAVLFVPPPESVEEVRHAIQHGGQADLVPWDPEGEAMSSPNQSYEAGSGMSPWVSQEELRWYALHTRARHEKTVPERACRDGPCRQSITLELSQTDCPVVVCTWFVT